MKPTRKTVAAQPSWVVRNKNIELAVTQLGGHMAPVTFYRNTARPVRPYYVNPWHGEGLKIGDPVLVPLRGDFFCLPFGANATPVGREQHVCHGEPATRKWTSPSLEKCGKVTALSLTMRTRIRPGKITKTLCLVDGQNVVYSQHLLEGFTGATSLGHHATLAVPEAERTLQVATSAFKLGLTNPTPTGDPKLGHYQSLALGGKFTDLSRVPLLWKDEPLGDCSAFPTRTGFDDLLGVFKKPTRTPAWTAATHAAGGFLWFSLKDAAVLPATLLWISNRGHHSEPMRGRNRCLGLEDVCGFFAEGLAESIKANLVKRAGFPTAVKLSPTRPMAVNYIQGVVKVPRSFGRVARVDFAPGKATFISRSRKKVTVGVQHEFLATGELA